MSEAEISQEVWGQVSAVLEGKLGLAFPEAHRDELRRKLRTVAKEVLEQDLAQLVQAIVEDKLDPGVEEAVVSALTVGETYFLREISALDQVVDALVARTLAGKPPRGKLFCWSAGCCTGEEPYSLAILLQERLGQRAAEYAEILATDLDTAFLRKAEGGVYGAWSFRSMPANLKARYFTAVGKNRFQLLPAVRDMVRFAQCNLTQPNAPLPAEQFDLILCRNVMMYLTDTARPQVLSRFKRSLKCNGFLIVSPAEVPIAVPDGFVSDKGFPQILRATSAAEVSHKDPWVPIPQPASTPEPAAPHLVEKPWVASHLDTAPPADAFVLRPETTTFFALQDFPQGNVGITDCLNSLNQNPEDVQAHLRLAGHLREHGSLQQAVQVLRRALYLDPHSAPAHFALASAYRQLGNHDLAQRHLTASEGALDFHDANTVLPDMLDMTARRLIELTAVLKGQSPS